METIAKVEYAALTPSQRQRHGDPNSEMVGVDSVFRRGEENNKQGWVTQKITLCVPRVDKNENTIVYTLKDRGHYLLSTVMSQTLPAIRVKTKFVEKFRIAWPSHVAHHIIRSGKLFDGGVCLQNITATFLDFYAQYYTKRNNDANMYSGNIPILTNWNSALPEYEVSCAHPWFYSKCFDNAIPIDAEHTSELEHCYDVRIQIRDLLRMQKKTDENTWVDIPTDMRLLQTSVGEKMATPQLWAEIACVTEEERRSNQKSPHVIEYEDYDYSSQKDFFSPGETVKVELLNVEPSEALFLGAQRIKMQETVMIEYLGNYSNSTDVNWVNTGTGPMRVFSMNYGTRITRLESIPSHVLAKFAEKHFPYTPDEPGYHVICHALLPGASHLGDLQTGIPMRSLEPTVSIVLSSGVLKYITDSNNEEVELDENGELPPINVIVEENYKYRIFTISMLQRKVIYKYNPTSKKYEINSPFTMVKAEQTGIGNDIIVGSPMLN